MATTIYEHNFGFWEIDCPEEQAFFEHVKSQSVRATCRRCDRLVRLMALNRTRSLQSQEERDAPE
jgi:hypothetical protein